MNELFHHGIKGMKWGRKTIPEFGWNAYLRRKETKGPNPQNRKCDEDHKGC